MGEYRQMKTRIVTAAVLIPLLILVVLVFPKSIGVTILSVMLSITAYELLYRTRFVRQLRLVLYSMIMAFGIGIWSYYGANQGVYLALTIAFFVLLFTEMMLDHIKVRLETLGLCFIGGLVVPYLLASLLRIFSLTTGRYMLVIPFVIAFSADAGAYFVGMRFGKHKLAPVVSPNKTIEGLAGGIASSVLGMFLYALILDFPMKLNVNYLAAMLYGFGGAALGSVGDLCFSAIKRQSGIKDYGNLIPGHGGALDRLDSLTLVAPFVEAMLVLLPIVE